MYSRTLSGADQRRQSGDWATSSGGQWGRISCAVAKNRSHSGARYADYLESGARSRLHRTRIEARDWSRTASQGTLHAPARSRLLALQLLWTDRDYGMVHFPPVPFHRRTSDRGQALSQHPGLHPAQEFAAGTDGSSRRDSYRRRRRGLRLSEASGTDSAKVYCRSLLQQTARPALQDRRSGTIFFRWPHRIFGPHRQPSQITRLSHRVG